MKKIYTLLLALMLVLPATYAQKGLSLGLNGEFLGTTIVNQNTWGNGHEYDYDISTGSAFGLDVGYNFNDKIGIYTGFSMMNLGQKYKDTYSTPGTTIESDWSRQLKFKYNVIPIMVKFVGSETTVNFIGGFGISIAMMKEASQIWTKDGADYHEIFENEFTGETFDMGAEDVTERFNKTDIFVNLEMGARIFFMDNLYMDATLNAGYGVKDMNQSDWQMKNKDGEYNPSHNGYIGAKIGIAYVLFGE